jgi:DNA-binding NtrC family response regulator
VRTIFLVEDEPALRRSIRAVLEAAGFRVIDSPDAAEAMLTLGPGEPADLLVSDILLPGISGVELARRLGTERPELRILLMSAQEPPPEVRERGIRFLPKPFTREALLSAIEAALSAPPPKRRSLTPHPARVLLVDDEESVRRSVSRFLRRRGHEVRECADGDDAHRILCEDPGHAAFDVVISDLHLPGSGPGHFLSRTGSGWAAIERKLILITGDSEGSASPRDLTERAIAVLYKPFDLEELADLVESRA